MSEKEEKKNKRTAVIVSVLIHSLLLCAFLFILAWKEPDPPLPEYGIELNFGLDNVGAGDIQPESEPVESESDEEASPENLPEEQTETVEQEPVEEVSEAVEEIVEETTSNVQDSPDVVEKEVAEEPEEPKPVVEEKPEPLKEEVKPVVEEVKEEVKNPADGADGKDGEASTQQEANHGDKVDEVGDQGNEQGTLDSRALYGKSGGGGGSALEMTGWMWDFRPKPNDTSVENGRIVFEIKIDDQGEILSVRTIERSVSPAVEKIYRAEVEKLTFSKTSDNSIVAPISTGRITFVIKSK